jgi:flagellar export protein FliJ
MSYQPRFTSLVHLHETREREARRQVGDLERQRHQVQMRIDALIEDRQAATNDTSLQAREQLTRYWIHIDAQMVSAQAVISKLDKDIDTARRSLAEAHRTHATFLKLQEQDKKHEQQRRERQDARRLEEFASLQYINRREMHQ